MPRRYVAIWFRQLTTDWLVLRRPELKDVPFVFVTPDHGRLIITAANPVAEQHGIAPGMRAADAKAMVPGLEVIDDKPGRREKLLKGLGEWCIRYSPLVAIDSPDGLIMDVSGCDHLWGGEKEYLKEIVSRLKSKGYTVRLSIADTIGTAWAISRYGKITPIIRSGEQATAILSLPPVALRLEPHIVERAQKLGFRTIQKLINIERSALRRRFGDHFLLRLGQALGLENEALIPIQLPPDYQERLPCMEPIRTRVGIEIAIQKLLESLCMRLQKDGKGIRTAILKGYRIDGQLEQVEIGTNQPSHSVSHLFNLFELTIAGITPALGIELFTLEAVKVDEVLRIQDALWTGKKGLADQNVAELLDRVAGKVGAGTIHRYLPLEHYWPERSIKNVPLQEKKIIPWRSNKPRPTEVLPRPELIEVTAPIPDYPPMLFRYRGCIHQIRKADGPERIEREWWLDEGEHRDYYQVEDDVGRRYWIFRSGHYAGAVSHQWFLHGFFA